MKLEDFNALTEEEKATYLSSVEAQEKEVINLTAERDSFKTENDTLKTQAEANAKELKATKELNFTLARKIDVADSSNDDEEILFNFMKGIKSNGN